VWIPCENVRKKGSHLGIKMPFPEITCKVFWIIILIFVCNSIIFWALLNDQHSHQIWISCEKALKQSSCLGIKMPFPKITCHVFQIMILILMCNSRSTSQWSPSPPNVNTMQKGSKTEFPCEHQDALSQNYLQTVLNHCFNIHVKLQKVLGTFK